MGKRLRTFRFDEELYGKFKEACRLGGVGVTGAFERFMVGCVEEGVWFFPKKMRKTTWLKQGFLLIGSVKANYSTVKAAAKKPTSKADYYGAYLK